MEKKEFKYIEVKYQLYTIENGNKELEEETSPDQPFRFISGFGATIPGFEKNIAKLNQGDAFDFTIEKEDAYGERYEERIIDLDKNIFCINGKLDENNVYEGAIIPLQNEDGNRFLGHVLEIGDKTIKIDLNHPLAGKALNFVGSVITSRDATTEEIQQMLNQLSGGCGGGCHGGCGGSCGGSCGGGDCEGGCGGDCNCNNK